MLLSKIGQGQFGSVFKALNQETNELFAIKCIEKSKLDYNPKMKELFNTEMWIMKTLNHPNILHLYDFFESSKNYYLVINFCNSGDLE